MKAADRIRELERELESKNQALYTLGKTLLNIAESELSFIDCEVRVLQEHPTVELAGTVYGGLAALTARLANMAMNLGTLGDEATKAAGMHEIGSAAAKATVN